MFLETIFLRKKSIYFVYLYRRTLSVMSNVNTGELLDFQDYSPEHNRSARIDVEAVHTNQYNNSNPSYEYVEPKPIIEEGPPRNGKLLLIQK